MTFERTTIIVKHSIAYMTHTFWSTMPFLFRSNSQTLLGRGKQQWREAATHDSWVMRGERGEVCRWEVKNRVISILPSSSLIGMCEMKVLSHTKGVTFSPQHQMHRIWGSFSVLELSYCTALYVWVSQSPDTRVETPQDTPAASLKWDSWAL